MMQRRTIVLILVAVAFSAAGQLLLKSGARHLAGLGPHRVPAGAAGTSTSCRGSQAWIAWTL